MRWDTRLVTGIFIGIVVTLQYHSVLVTWFPVLVIATLVLLLKLIRR